MTASSGSESLGCRPKGRRYKVGVKSRPGCDANDAITTLDPGEYGHADRAAPIKNPDGFDRNVAFCVAGHCGYSSPARGCDAPGSRKSTTKEAILDGRKKHHGDESHLGPHRADDECHGAHRTRGLLVADVLDPGDHGGDCTRDVAGDLCRFTPLFGNGRCLCRAIEALSGSRQFLLFRGAVLPESRKALALCAAGEVYRGLGLASVLLDLPRGDGGGNGNFRGLRGRYALAELHERFQSGYFVHDDFCDFVCAGCLLYRPSRGYGLDGGERGHQRNSDQRAFDLFGDRDWLPAESSSGKRSLAVRFRLRRGVSVSV